MDEIGNLIVTRKPEQSLLIGDDIRVTVVSVIGDKVRLSIKAPKDVAVVRDELIAHSPEDIN